MPKSCTNASAVQSQSACQIPADFTPAKPYQASTPRHPAAAAATAQSAATSQHSCCAATQPPTLQLCALPAAAAPPVSPSLSSPAGLQLRCCCVVYTRASAQHPVVFVNCDLMLELPEAHTWPADCPPACSSEASSMVPFSDTCSAAVQSMVGGCILPAVGSCAVADRLHD